MNAIDIADSLVREFHADLLNFDTALNAAVELHRLAAIEQKYMAIMAQKPIGYISNYGIKALKDNGNFYPVAIRLKDSQGYQPVYTLPKY